MTPSLQQMPAASGDQSGPLHRWTGIATVLGTVVGFLALVVAVLAWLLPKQSAPEPEPTATTTVTVTATATATTTATVTAPPTGAFAVFLDAGDFTPEAGADRLTPLPRAVRGDAGYADHPIAVSCPSNQTGDEASDVTFPLRGRYVQFDATVHPYYPPGADRQSVTYVTALTGTRERDGTLTITEAGSQKRATPGAPLPLSVAVDEAENLTVRVQCDDPRGTIVLTGARLTPR